MIDELDMYIHEIGTPYAYLIGWTKHNTYYYGIRYSRKCHPSDLWVRYFTSSSRVRKFREDNGEPDIIEVRRTFSTPDQAIRWENKVLRRMGVLFKDNWLNQNIGGFIYIAKQSRDHVAKRTSGRQGKTPRAREASIRNLRKASETNRGRKQSEETQVKKRETYRKNWSKNSISAKRSPRTIFLIDGIVYIGLKAVVEEFNITEPTVYNRLASTKWNWERLS